MDSVYYEITLNQSGKRNWYAHVTVDVMSGLVFHARTRERALRKAERWIEKDRKARSVTETIYLPRRPPGS